MWWAIDPVFDGKIQQRFDQLLAQEAVAGGFHKVLTETEEACLCFADTDAAESAQHHPVDCHLCHH